MRTKNNHKKIIAEIVKSDGQENPDFYIGLESDNEELYNQYRKIWNESKYIQFPDFNEDNASKQLNKRLYEEKKKFKISTILKIAAILLVILLTTFLVSQLVPDKRDNQLVEIIVQKGERLTIKLPDGNKVWLNSNSSIKYPANFTGLNKRIDIKGEAYCDLRNNGFYPIMISTNNVLINCSSAVFNVKSDINHSGNTEIIVEKGWVSLTNGQMRTSMEVAEGNKAFISPLLPLSIESGFPQNDLAWKTGKIIFDNTPLQTVASVLSEFYDKQVRIEGDLKYCEFSSTYENKDMSVIIEDILKNYKSKLIHRPNELIIRGNICN